MRGGPTGRKVHIPGLIITIVLLLIAIEFIGLLAVTKLVPVYLIFAVGIAILTCVLLICLLTGDFRKKVRFVIGIVLGSLFIVLLVVGNLFVLNTYNTLTRISGVNTKTSQIGIYVLKNDAAQTIEDAKDYTFGTLSSLDKKNTQEAVKQIQTLLGQPVKQQSADGVTKLVDSLMDGSCGVIILNHAYLPILSEMEGYTDIENKIRELDILDVNTVIEE